MTATAPAPATAITAPVFDFPAFFTALDAARRARDLDWYELAARLWDQSADLNADRGDHPLCGGAVSRLGRRGATSCQYAMFMLRWLARPPEDFLVSPVEVGATQLPGAGPNRRLRWDLAALYAALDDRRRRHGLTWVALGAHLRCSPSRLTNLRTARQADLELAMRATQWLARPAADFIVAADW